MRLLYLDCFAGVSGDMFLGALLDLGVSLETVRAQLERLDLAGWQISARQVNRQNITATKFDVIEALHPVTGKPAQPQRGYRAIARLIDASSLAALVKQRAKNVFHRIGTVEARIHGTTLDAVHFHEVGAVDSILDIVGVCVALEELKVDAIHAAPPPLGSGFVETAHGRFPVPAPATLELLKGIPTQRSTLAMELVTPTGAALLAEYCVAFGPSPAMTVERIGYGAGSRELGNTPNVLRVMLGTAAEAVAPADAETDAVTVIEANIDDMNPQLFGPVMDELFRAGALDVFLTPIQMKKQRPGTLLTALAAPADADRLADLILAHTTTFGVRLHDTRRRKLAREIVTVATPFGAVAVKIGRRGGKVLTRSPEFESCKQLAAAAGVAVKAVHDAAVSAAKELG